MTEDYTLKPSEFNEIWKHGVQKKAHQLLLDCQDLRGFFAILAKDKMHLDKFCLAKDEIDLVYSELRRLIEVIGNLPYKKTSRLDNAKIVNVAGELWLCTEEDGTSRPATREEFEAFATQEQKEQWKDWHFQY